MPQLKLVLPLFILLTFSFFSVFADTGDITVVSGKSFTIHYNTKDSQVINVQTNKEDQGLVFSIQANSPVATLELTLPRDLIDATETNGKPDFIVLLDGTFASWIDKGSTSTTRTILVQLAPDNKELEVIGTFLSTSESPPPTTTQTATQPTVVPPTPQGTPPEQKPTQNPPAPQTPQNQPPTTENPEQIKIPNLPSFLQQIPFDKITSWLQLKPENLTSSLDKKYLMDYSVVAAIILVIIIVITSAARSKTKRQVRN